MTMLDDAAAATAGDDEGERIGSCDGCDIKTVGAVQYRTVLAQCRF